MTSNNTHLNDTIATGKEAARFWGLSVKHGESGDANAIVALVHAQRTMTFEATVERKKEETAETFEFNVSDLSTPYWNNDGSKDTRKMAARTACLADKLFGISELSNAIKTRLARCIKVADYLIRSLANETDEAILGYMDGDKEIPGIVRLEKGKLVVPYGLVAPEPAEDASSKEKAVYAAMKADGVALDGKDGLSLAELSKRANPPKANRAAGEQTDKGASLSASIDFVSAVIKQNLSEDSEDAVADVALSTELRRKLFAMAQDIAAYFAADPLEEEEELPAAANA